MGLRSTTFIVTENCINCKFQDCVEVCLVDCFDEAENLLAIHPEECLDCGVCEPECPTEAIVPDAEAWNEDWLAINTTFAEIWPNITEKGGPAEDAEDWQDKPCKREFLSEAPGECS